MLSTAYTAVLASFVGYGIWNSLLGRHQASAVVPFMLLVPVFGMGSAWLVFDEVPNAAEASGGALLLAGVATVALAGRRTRAAATAAPVAVDNGRHD
ncbi:EamA family transporter [Nocardioides daphniae]|uniref:EamA family transporter n=1 Tax=Nocardioides daphniae TaxID=402297 RepID=UPI0019311324|nr:EamA family transporter [Nocardioides daphniae]